MRRSWSVLSSWRASHYTGREMAPNSSIVDPLPDDNTSRYPTQAMASFQQLHHSPFRYQSFFSKSGYTIQPCLHVGLNVQSCSTQVIRYASTGSKSCNMPASGEMSINLPKDAESFGQRMLKLLGWMGGFYSRKAVLTRSSQNIYASCMNNLKYEDFFEVCSLPDTFQSWFLIAHLHLWLLLVRLKREGGDGDYLIKQVVLTFWEDVQSRMRELGVYNSRVASQSLRELVQQFYGITLAYEEGLLSSDKALASAIWRNVIFDREKDTEPAKLAKMVEYVRKQVKHMDQLDSKILVETGNLSLLPLNES